MKTIGWCPTCRCPGQRGRTAPAVVLDPFAGSGTALAVARDLRRHAVGVELNPAYVALAAERLRQEVLWTAPPTPTERAVTPAEAPTRQGELL